MAKKKTLTKAQKIIERLNQVKNWQVAVLIVVLGASTFWSGLTGGFQGDDFDQIVDNEAVHSIGNIGEFFSSSTFWNGHQLVGDFYRPTMSTTFSIIYSIFGENPIPFHVVQLLLYMASAFMLFLLLKHFLRPFLALLITLLLLVHPINTQVVYAIPSMQEPLFFLPGISALYILTRSRSLRALFGATLLLFLSLLSKETGAAFVILSIAYLFMFHRERTWTLIKFLIVPVVFYLMLRFNAVGVTHIAYAAPIDHLTLWERMLTMPSIFIFYLSQFFFPKDLASIYYWTNPTFTVDGVLLPLIGSLAVIGAFIGAGFYLKKRASHARFLTYLFFSGWFFIALGPYMQFIPIDMTACEIWFYLAQVGFVGAIATFLVEVLKKVPARYLLLLLIPYVVVLGLLMARSIERGFDFATQETIAKSDIAIVPNNYYALNNLGRMNIRSGDLATAKQYVERSIEAYPTVSNYNNLGVIAQKEGRLVDAREAYEKALEYVKLAATYENLAILYSATADSETNVKFLSAALLEYPTDTRLITFLAIHQAALGQRQDAIKNLNVVYRLGGPIPEPLAIALNTGEALDIPVPGTDTVIHIPAEENKDK